MNEKLTQLTQLSKIKKREQKENKFLNALVYFIMIATVVMIAPLVYKLADEYWGNRTPNAGDGELASERTARNRRYTVIENTIDLSGLGNTGFGALGLITAKITDGGELILFCSGRAETPASTEARPEHEDIVRIVLLRDIENGVPGNIDVSGRAVRNNFLYSLQNKDYVFRDYGDGTFFLSNNRAAFLFDTENMRTTTNFAYPQNLSVYQSALANDKETLALATEQGFFVANPREANMTISPANMKELIAPITSGGVTMTARDPVWSSGDQRIFYRLYADNFVVAAGVTASIPGENERLRALEATNFIFLNDDVIFYYFTAGEGAGTTPGNLFRCGYFNITERRMSDIMRSQVNYFAIDVSSNGTHLAALSPNGNLIKLSVIDIHTKRLIYSSLYDEIYDFSFSPDEKNLVIYGRSDNARTLRVINIDWTEE
jgi:hypothetical protein